MQIQLLLEMAEDFAGDRLAVRDMSRSLTYGELAQCARAGALSIGERDGGKLVFIGQNGAMLPVSLFAAAIAGKPFVPLNYRLSDPDLRKLLARTAPSVAIVDDEMMERVAGIEGISYIARSAFEARCAAGGAGDRVALDDGDDRAILLFTSGTTGEPKVAVLRHANLSSYVISTVDFMGAGEEESSLVSVPPYHIAAISAVLTGIYSGRCIVYLRDFSAEGWTAAVDEFRISHAMVVPTMLGRILDAMEQHGRALPSLRSLSYGGGRMPVPVIERGMTLLPRVDFTNAYGLTETSSTVAVLSPNDHRAAMSSSDDLIRRRLASVGRPLPSIELEVRDLDGARCGTGKVGEIHVRGPQVSGEYQGKSLLDQHGWFPTRDSGYLDKDGYLFVEGRLDDVIVRGGENISPGEIEDILRNHPAVHDVAVVGLPDDQWGEKVAAFIVPTADEPSTTELAGWVRAQVRSTKTPEVWLFRKSLPYNDMGKLVRRQLRAEY